MATADAIEVSIDFARLADLEFVIKLAASRRLDSMPVAEASREGFLVSNYTPDDYRELMVRAEHFYVARVGQSVAGFIIGYTSDRVGPEEWLNTQLKTQYDKFVVIKQVCVDPAHASQGIATLLYEYVIARAPGVPVVAAVVLDPENEPSTKLHKRLGFQPTLALTPPDGLRRLVWVRPSLRPEMLLQQYPIAVDLYKHEDALNWNKLNNFLYITAALVAALGFAAGITGNGQLAGSNVIILVVSLIGVASSAVFGIALWFGVRYLQARKDAVRLIERLLVESGGTQVITPELLGKPSKWQELSPTTTALRVFPAVTCVCWLGIMAVIIRQAFT